MLIAISNLSSKKVASTYLFLRSSIENKCNSANTEHSLLMRFRAGTSGEMLDEEE